MSLAYACNCLNVRLHVASTIDSTSSLTDELGSELMGWKLSLGVGGIVIEQKPLVRLRQVSHAPSWATLSCLVCGTQDIFSILFDDQITRLDNPDWDTLLIPESNSIIIHEGLKDATEIEALKKLPNFSCTFQLVIRSPNESHDGKGQLENKELREQLQLTLDDRMKLEEQKTRERIAAYKKQQEERLAALKKTAQEELAILETMISQALHKPQVEQPKPLDETLQHSPHPDSSTTGSMKKGSSRQRVRFEESDQKTAGTESGKTHEQPSNLGKAIQTQKDIKGDGVEAEVTEEDGMEDNSDDEDVFELDEELETRPDGVADDENAQDGVEPVDEEEDEVAELESVHDLKAFSLPASSPLLLKARRRNSQKYPAGNMWDETQEKVHDTHDDSTMFATSLPINITKFKGKWPVQPPTEDEPKDKPVRFGTTYDPSLTEMVAMSAQLQSLPNPFNRAVSEERFKHDHDDDDDGPMIPPHILAAQAYVVEGEEIYGTAPDTDR
ncbi:hypothetical protein BC943DRAFT_328931 [Umbelopsis sp. AD052]|nr:hypothetical protein BC943DRAFT_328931 [Umbelopsis sp. AD052]